MSFRLRVPQADGHRNPVANLKMIKQELKKDCITLITGQHYGLFNSLRFNMMGLPEMNLEEADAEGAYVRFFEQAFEWDQLSKLYSFVAVTSLTAPSVHYISLLLGG